MSNHESRPEDAAPWFAVVPGSAESEFGPDIEDSNRPQRNRVGPISRRGRQGSKWPG